MNAMIPVIEAVSSPVSTATVSLDPTPLGFVALDVLAAIVGSALGSLMRVRRSFGPIGFDATPRPAGA
ncbi:MAG: hypothetical protein ACKO2K_18100 [Alphaproteobacteria bacterium]